MNKDFKINDKKILIAMVGLPARGKSFTSNRLSNYLNWCEIKCQILSIDKPLVIIAHQAINRVLLGYLMGHSLQDIPSLDGNLNEVIKLTPNSRGYTQEVIKL